MLELRRRYLVVLLGLRVVRVHVRVNLGGVLHLGERVHRVAGVRVDHVMGVHMMRMHMLLRRVSLHLPLLPRHISKIRSALRSLLIHLSQTTQKTATRKTPGLEIPLKTHQFTRLSSPFFSTAASKK